MKKILLMIVTSLFALSLTGCFGDDHEHGEGGHSHDAPTNTHDSMKQD